MTEDDLYAERRARDSQGEAWRDRGRRFTRYLTNRSAESWLFFAAGLAIGAVFL